MRVRKLGPGALTWASGYLNGGDAGDVPTEVARRYAHKLELLEELPLPAPVTPDEVIVDAPAKPKPKPRKRAKKAVKHEGGRG